MQKDLKLKLGLLGKIGALLRKFGHFGKKMGLLEEKSVRKGHFGENWAVEVKTVLIQKMSVPKLLEVKIWSFR